MPASAGIIAPTPGLCNAPPATGVRPPIGFLSARNAGKHVNLHRFGTAVLLAAISSGAVALNDQSLTEKWPPLLWGPDEMAGSVN